MTTDEVPSSPELAELKCVLNDAGCPVDVHNAHGEWMEITLPSGAVAKIEWVRP